MNKDRFDEVYQNDLNWITENSEKYWGVSSADFLSKLPNTNMYYKVYNARILLDRISGGRCCPKAEQVPCMCEISYFCPDHGSRCKGSHD